MMTIVYDLIFLVFSIFYLPIFLFKRKMHAGFRVRLGFLPPGSRFHDPIWIHAVSVGEAMSIRHLVESLRKKFPHRQFVISTVTATGNKIARSIAAENDAVLYLPLDFSFIVRGVIDRVNPSLFVIAETEIWPNLISYLFRRSIPIVVVNGRISDRSLKGYRLSRCFISPLLNMVSIFCVQSEKDAQRLVTLGVSREKIRGTGNMKFDIEVRDYEALRRDYTDYRMKLGLSTKEWLWVAASTHPGEEEAIVGAYRTVLRHLPDFKLLIAPRHPERSLSIAKQIDKFPDLKAVRVSQVAQAKTFPGFHPDTSGRRPVFILDTIGQLMYFYALSDIVFVGGSLVKKGGHNILEPASLGKPIIFGPHMFNFSDITELFLKKKAGIMVNSQEELAEALESLLGNHARIAALGESCRTVILENQGATGRNTEMIQEVLKNKKRGTI